MYFDEEGALYVTDSSGDSRKAPVQVKEPSHRILRLTDEDGDGVFDHSTVFAEKVPFPEGILVYKGDEISLKGGGGPTCLTRPLMRNLR